MLRKLKIKPIREGRMDDRESIISGTDLFWSSGTRISRTSNVEAIANMPSDSASILFDIIFFLI